MAPTRAPDAPAPARLKERLAAARAEAEAHAHRQFEVGVPMRDGVLIAVDVYLPSPERLPAATVLTPHTGYDKAQAANAVTGRYWNEQGYAFVIADARGRGKSEGERDLANGWGLGADGYDLVEWIARQPWSNGRIGGWGTSWHAAAQVTTALEQPPHLACIVPAAPGGAFRGSAMLRETHYERGCFTLGVRATALAGTAGRVQNPPTFDVNDALRLLPLSRTLELIRNPVLDHLLEHDTLDDWWRSQQVDGRGHDVEVPALHVVGWFDVPCRRGTLKGYEETMCVSSARDQQWLIVGPWTHGIGSRAYQGLDFGPEADFDLAEAAGPFYDHYLRGVDNGWELTPRVRLFETGTNVWRSPPAWPPPSTETAVYLTADGRLAAEIPISGRRSYRYDPLDPVAPLVGRGPGGMDAPMEQSYLHGRADVLRWESPPLAEELVVSGWPRLRLFASSDRDDTDWHVRLVDVFPDGRAYEVAQARMRASYRDSLSDPTPLVRDHVYPFDFELTALTHAFLPGHWVAVTVTSSDFPMYARSLNRFGKLRDQAEPRVATNTVWHGGSFSSHLVLPVTRGAFKARS